MHRAHPSCPVPHPSVKLGQTWGSVPEDSPSPWAALEPSPYHWRSRSKSARLLTGGDFGECCNRHTDTCMLLRAQEQLYKPQALLLCLEPVFPLKSIAQRTRERAGSPALPIVTRLTQPLQLQLFSLGTKQRCLQRDRALLPPTSLGELHFLLVPGKKRRRSQAFKPETSK